MSGALEVGKNFAEIRVFWSSLFNDNRTSYNLQHIPNIIGFFRSSVLLLNPLAVVSLNLYVNHRSMGIVSM